MKASRGRSWFSDFTFTRGRVQVLDTGANLSLDPTLIGDALIWLAYHAVVRAKSWWMLIWRPDAPRIWFAPRSPRPWYLVWSAMAWAGIRFARSLEEADAVFAFEDATISARPAPPRLPAFNHGCRDISKSHVAALFEEVFGYPLALDPSGWSGEAVEKSELNGAHDGRIVACPAPRKPNRHYERLIDTRNGAFTYDLRTACIGREPIGVWIKRKSAKGRFSIQNLAATLHAPETVFAPEELILIRRFLARIQVDWAGLDILRDRGSGRIYIVDVNKTDVGPIIALSFIDKLRSTRLLAQALDDLLPGQARLSARQRSGRRSGRLRAAPPSPAARSATLGPAEGDG